MFPKRYNLAVQFWLKAELHKRHVERVRRVIDWVLLGDCRPTNLWNVFQERVAQLPRVISLGVDATEGESEQMDRL